MIVLSTIIFLLFPTLVLGGIGDVYYCNTKKVVEIKNSKLKQFKNFTFKFKRNQNSLNFGTQKNYFDKTFLPKLEFQSGEYFVYNGELGITVFYYKDSNFTYSLASDNKIVALSGSCSVF